MVFTPEAEIYRRFKQKEQLLDWFEPFPYQREAYLSTKPVQLIEGGNRSGKTHLAVAKIVKIALGLHPTIIRPRPMRIRIVATVLKEGVLGIILEKLKELMPTIYLEGGTWDKAYRSGDGTITLADSTLIQLMANSQDIQSHRGAALDLAMIDEECDENIFDETLTRLADRSGILLFSMTPHNGMTWSYKKLVKASRTNPDIGYYHLDTLSNYMINRKDWIRKSSILNDKEFAIRIKGLRIANEGLVYYMFNDRTHVIHSFDLPEGTQLFLGVDFGINNPHAGSLWAITPENKKYIIDEYYETGKTVEQNGLAQGLWVKNRWGKYRLRWVAADPMSGTQRNEQTNETNFHVFRKAFCEGYGKAVPILPGNREKGAVEHRINSMRELLTLGDSGLPEILVFSNCIQHMNEFEDYVWGSRKDENLNQFERPKGMHDHLMNACEYIAERNPAHMKTMFAPREVVPMELQYGSIGR